METEANEVTQRQVLQLASSLRETAEQFSKEEGISLNDFISAAVKDKIAHLQHVRWMESRRPITPERIRRAFELLEKGAGEPPEPGDELPEGYQRTRYEDVYPRSASREA